MKKAAGIKAPKSAIVLLKADYREVEGLFKSFKRSESDAERQSLAKQICAALKLHTRLEEEIFYPAFIKATGDEEIHNEALVEHDSAKKLIKEIESSVAGDPLFDARIAVLSEMIKHHVREEERFSGMFTKARIAGMDLRALGILIAAFLALGTASCSDPSGDDGGLDVRSRSTGERDERLGNDPAKQNTGEGSNPENEPAPQGAPQQ